MCKVLVDNLEFQNIYEAEKFLEMKPNTLVYKLRDNNEIVVNGLPVKRLGNKKIYSKIICKQTGEVYNTISDLAQALNIGKGNISNALLKNKIFRRNGLSYIRLDEKSDLERLRTQSTEPKQDTLDLVVPNKSVTLPKENAVTVIRNLVKQNVDSGQYYVAKLLIDVLEKLENEKNIVNNS